MRASTVLSLAFLSMALIACGKEHSANNYPQVPPSAALTPPLSTALPPASPAQQQEAGLTPTRPTKVTRPNEDGSETVEETTGDSGTHNPLYAAVASTIAATTASASAASTASAASASAASASAAPTGGAAQWQEGVNYTRLVPAQPTAVPPGQVEVLEFFWYGCPHCYAIDPLVESWKKSKPAFISFSRVPVMWSEGHRSTARLYYTLESMGKLDQLHTEVFKEIHVNGDPLITSDPNDAAGAERVQTAFVKKLGIPEDAFKKAYHSFSVETSLQRADQLVQRYRIEGVPTFVINGKFVADVRSAGAPERLMSLVGDLAAQEHKR